MQTNKSAFWVAIVSKQSSNTKNWRYWLLHKNNLKTDQSDKVWLLIQYSFQLLLYSMCTCMTSTCMYCIKVGPSLFITLRPIKYIQNELTTSLLYIRHLNVRALFHIIQWWLFKEVWFYFFYEEDCVQSLKIHYIKPLWRKHMARTTWPAAYHW